MFTIIKYNFKVFVTHRLDFFLSLISIFLNQGLSLIFLYIIITKIPNLKGWDFKQLILIYGLFLLNKGTADFFSSGAYNIESYVRNGTLDNFIIHPLPVLLQIFSSQFDFFQFINILTGLAFLGYSVALKTIEFNFFNLAIIIFFQVVSVITIFYLRVLTMCVTFWTQTGYPISVTVDNLSNFSKYPLSIYNKILLNMLIYLLPYGFLSYFPALILLKLGGRIKIIGISFLIIVCVCSVSLFTWRRGLARYESSGH
ncbi:hypothetical protein ERK19_04980 [Lactobacillus helsingborgensis]|uniref:ABC transporter permease n=1 Tax=Lactobacillus helsingborgensis TaxID=1218494 RepID=UPI00164F1C46|nr:ABC-2 family transporter protein [Lactobacillus helsingborgensis]MBC6356704.1 hypothetical protein [Lactobacillus helsingborgensis]